MSNEAVKKIGLWNIVGLGVGGAVVSGIFVTLGSAIAKTGRSILPITVICVFYMIIPQKYPEQFAKRAIRFPVWLYNACSILGGFCAIVITITLFKGLTAKDAIVAACIVIIPVIFSALALKQKSVDAKVLDERKAEIVKATLNADK